MANSNFSLASIPTFKAAFDTKKSSLPSSSSRRGTFISFDDVIRLYLDHKKTCSLSKVLECRFLVAAMTGLRLINTFRFEENARINMKKCAHCVNELHCPILKIDCFETLTIFRTKNGDALNVPIIPQIRSCINQISAFDREKDYKRIYEDFNSFMQMKFNCTPHKVRQILPNLISSRTTAQKNNTGGWKNTRTMNTHYVGANMKFLEAFVLLVSAEQESNN